MSTPDYTDWPSEWMWPHIMNVLLINKEHLRRHPDRTVIVSLVPGDADHCDRCRKQREPLTGFILELGRVRFIMQLCPACVELEWGNA